MRYYCPADDIDCPYYRYADGLCKMSYEGLNPEEECDAYFGLVEDELDDMEFEERWGEKEE